MQKIIAANGGIETVTPLSVVTWTAEPVKSSGAEGSDRVVALYGEAAGGEPGKPYTFSDPVTAARTLISGDLLRGVQYAFANGAPDGQRPRAVVAVNVKGGSQASYAVRDAAGKTVFTLKTLTYREAANQTTLSLTGDRTKGFNLQVRDPVTGAALGYTKLGIGLYVQYVGGGKAATAEITEVAGARYFKTTVTGGDAGESLLIPLAGLTVRQLAEQIQKSGPYNVFTARSAVLPAAELDLTQAALDIRASGLVGEVQTEVAPGTADVTLEAASPRALSAGETLKFRAAGVWRFVQVAEDAAAGTALKIRPVTFAIPQGAVLLDSSTAAAVALTAVKADFADFLTTKGQGVVQYLPGDADAGDPAQQGGNFSGGGSAAATISDWEAGVEASLDEDFGSACALTDDQGVVFGVRARLQAARHPREGKFIQLFSGVSQDLLPTGESDAELEIYLQNVSSHVAAINDRDSVVLAQAADAVNPQSGRLERIAPYFLAAMAAGYAASVGRDTSLTYKTLAAANPFPNLRTRKDDFTLSGVTVLVPPKKGQAARIELGRTAYVGEDNTIYESEKSVRLMNSVAREIKLIQEALVPGEATKAALARYKRELTRYFDGLVEKQLLQPGYDQDGNAVPAYEFKVGRTQYQGRLVTTTAKVNPTGEFVVADFYLRARPVEIEV
ncbi:hypothetical protein [Deinococcus sp. S9]|uniref:hypothetical protein n=1 Tax=Deinococcus sp. S9 TaxID=2545754 RepID=UPI001055BE2A|nr:hypothetical protein [Deinococcus sp. S9]TDE85577.1 hypothetical protein E0686_11235 [Deinococcus sp. S9]